MKTYKHSIIWGNPYTEPPKPLPRTIYSVVNTDHRPDSRLKHHLERILDKLQARGIRGFNIGFQAYGPIKVSKKWSDEAKFRNRIKRLKQRIAKKYSIPMLYEQALEASINKKPEYYGVKNNA